MNYYTFEIYQNVILLTVFYPKLNKIDVLLHANIELNDNLTTNILNKISQNNTFLLEKHNITKENIHIKTNFKQEFETFYAISDRTIHSNKGYSFYFDDNNYHLCMLAIIKENSDNINNHYIYNKSEKIKNSQLKINQLLNPKERTTYYELKNSQYLINIKRLNENKSIKDLNPTQLLAQIGEEIREIEYPLRKKQTIETSNELKTIIDINVFNSLQLFDLYSQTEYKTPFKIKNKLIKRYADKEFKGKDFIKEDTTYSNFIINLISPNEKLKDDDVISLAYPLSENYMYQLIKEPYYPQLKNNLDTFKGFNDYYLDDLISKADITPNMSDNEKDNALNHQIKQRAKFDPLFEKVFFWENKEPHIIAKDMQLQINILEFLYQIYGLEDNIYNYFKQYVGLDINDQKNKKLQKKLDAGETTLFAPNIPTYLKVSKGAIYGAYINLKEYNKDYQAWEKEKRDYNKIRKHFRKIAQNSINKKSNPMGWKLRQYLKNVTDKDYLELIETIDLNDYDIVAAIIIFYVKANSVNYSEYKNDLLIDLKPKRFVRKKEHIKYKQKIPQFIELKEKPDPTQYTQSIMSEKTIHVDIKSFYPTQIDNLDIVKNKSNQKPMKKIMIERFKLQKTLPENQNDWTKEDYNNDQIQIGQKRIINSASGALDTEYEHNIKVKNKAYRMRLCNQLLFLILNKQLVLFEHAIPLSIHTDGVYLIKNKEIKEAKGQNLKYYKGPNLTGSINRPYLIDNTIANLFLNEYLNQTKNYNLDKEQTIQQLQEEIDYVIKNGTEKEKETLLLKYQIILKSNEIENKFIVKNINESYFYTNSTYRLFYIKDEIIDIATQTNGLMPFKIKNLTSNKSNKKHNATALEIAVDLNLINKKLFHTKKVNFNKLNNISEDQLFIQQNKKLSKIDKDILYYLDLDAYFKLIEINLNQWNPILQI